MPSISSSCLLRWPLRASLASLVSCTVPPALIRLRRAYGELAAILRDRASYLQRPLFKVYVFPLEGQQLTLPEPALNGHRVESVEAVAAYSFEEPTRLF